MAATDEDLETWRNVGQGRICLTFPDGKERKTEVIHGGRTFYIDPADRRRISNEVADAERDPFRNGTCEPMMEVFGNDREMAELKASPNVLTATDMGVLVQLPQAAFDSELAEITNPITLGRLLEAADMAGAPARRTEAINARIEALRPIATQESDPDIDDAGDDPAETPRPGLQKAPKSARSASAG